MAVAPYRIHRMIQDLMKDSVAAAKFAADPELVFEQYGLLASEIALLRAGSLEAMTALGVHPNLQMKYIRLTAPPVQAGQAPPAGPLDAYLDRLMER